MTRQCRLLAQDFKTFTGNQKDVVGPIVTEHFTLKKKYIKKKKKMYLSLLDSWYVGHFVYLYC